MFTLFNALSISDEIVSAPIENLESNQKSNPLLILVKLVQNNIIYDSVKNCLFSTKNLFYATLKILSKKR